jgi:hypothetical protein
MRRITSHPAISAMIKVPDRRLISKASQQWTNFVSIPLKPSVTTKPPSLSKPKPDQAFGYSEKAFTDIQLDTIHLLTDMEMGRSYAVPYTELYFPFLVIEFKALANGGSHVIVANQAANAGAVVGHGLVELARHASELDSLDHDEPQFFSLSKNHQSANVYVHWLSIGADDGQYCFYIEWLSLHSLRDLDGLRAIQRTIKNIFDWSVGKRLPMICKQLGVHRQRIQVERTVAERAAAAAASESVSVESEPRNRQKLKGRKRKNSTVNATAPNAQGKLAPRRAPPLILQSAQALSNFIPESKDEQLVLRFDKGEMIEFVSAKAIDENGWVKGRVKGGDRTWGLVPIEYLELKSIEQMEGGRTIRG